MAEYIDRAALMAFPIRANHCDKEHANEHFINGIETVMEYAENLPSADVEPVVRCKDCEYIHKALYGWLLCTAGPCEGKVVLEDFFCKCGERRESNADR